MLFIIGFLLFWFVLHLIFANVKVFRDAAAPERIQEDFIISDVDKQDWWKTKEQRKFEGVPEKD